ncbi:probable 2-oxoglutarate-dependent dioxygenase AOP1 isoform X2 [Triticum dicoccoides]|uniref:probable 2-oxoglutarate-dependent dioxygenase AOP1 isoform X2 n=1 Tax=Triticum dicoccoides TaxID=85692 RepID=UPI00188E5E72|nr:probable 2-oxoglutarate-dependent dioxygenase AOP1 isoform X2 [Triticum dicoccoides]
MAASPSSTLVSPPRVDLDGEDTSTLVRGTPEWLRCAGLVRRALEANGCVAVGCRRHVPPELRERMLVAMAELFALPPETKRRTGAADGPYRAYMEKRDSAACHHEAFGVLNAAAGGCEEARAFVARAWPHGNDRFLETLTSTAGEMARLGRVILAMVVDSYGLSHRSDEVVDATDTNFRMLRYHNDTTRASSLDGQPAVGLAAHVDGSYLTVLFQNDVDGFELRTRDGGEWVRVHSPGPESLLVVAGQPLVAWSNGRVHAPVHRVAVGGREDRLSCGVFLLPSKNLVVDAPPELVTVDAPRRFRPFEYSDYLRFKHAGGNGEDVLDRFAGI